MKLQLTYLLKIQSPTSNEIKINLNILSPVPHFSQHKGTVTSIELTSSPYKTVLGNENNKKQNTAKRKLFTTKPKKQKIKKSKGDWFCHVCGEDREENMIQCLQCKTWVHDICVGVNKKRSNIFAMIVTSECKMIILYAFQLIPMQLIHMYLYIT